jgi:hypothetical protein
MDILNFISWIKGSRVVTTVDPAKTLLPVGLKDPKRDDGYLTGAISVADLAAQIGGGGAIPVLTVYPTTTLAEAGNQFWYKGNLWHYMTQAEIDSTGWTGLVTVGFPAPVSKNLNPSIAGFFAASLSTSPGIYSNIEPNTIIDFLGWSNPNKADRVGIGGNSNIIGFRNAMLLVSLKDQGTATAFVAPSLGMSASSINDLFTQLPLTTNVATITVTGNPGAATCDPTIATGKGYIVIT